MKLSAVAASLTCIAAGIYLLGSESVGEPTWFETIAHGMGIYFIGKGIFVGALLWAHAERREQDQSRRPEAAPSTLTWRKRIGFLAGLVVVGLGAAAAVSLREDDSGPERFTDPNGNECLAEHVTPAGFCP